MVETINQRFKTALKICIERHIIKNKADFSKKSGIKPPRLSEITGGRMGINSDICKKTSAILGINLNWLVNGTGEMFMSSDDSEILKDTLSKNDGEQTIDQIRIPILNHSVLLGDGTNITDDTPGENAYISLPSSTLTNTHDRYIGYRVGDNSMAPAINEGDLVIARLLQKTDWNTLPYEQAYILCSSKNNQIKRIRKRIQEGAMECTSDNANKLLYPDYTVHPDTLESIWYIEYLFTNKLHNIINLNQHKIQDLENRIDKMMLLIEELQKK